MLPISRERIFYVIPPKNLFGHNFTEMKFYSAVYNYLDSSNETLNYLRLLLIRYFFFSVITVILTIIGNRYKLLGCFIPLIFTMRIPATEEPYQIFIGILCLVVVIASIVVVIMLDKNYKKARLEEEQKKKCLNNGNNKAYCLRSEQS